VADHLIDARSQTGTAPDEKTEMRYPTRASELVDRRLQVPPSPLHDPSVPQLHASTRGEELLRALCLTWDIRGSPWPTLGCERPRRRGALRRRGVNGLGTGFAGITINHEVLDRIGAINVAGCGTGGLTTVSIEPISLC
jgi:hypothetical protein